MSDGIITMAYIVASILFILALGGLSNQETARKGNYYGMAAMAIALVATVVGIVTGNYLLMLGCIAVGGIIGFILAKKVEMTQMPELVAILHSLVGLAAVLVGFGTYLDHSAVYSDAELTIHNVEIYLGILIGALTFSGSVMAYLKLSAKIGGKPLTLPGRHFLNLLFLCPTITNNSLFYLQWSIFKNLKIILSQSKQYDPPRLTHINNSLNIFIKKQLLYRRTIRSI